MLESGSQEREWIIGGRIRQGTHEGSWCNSLGEKEQLLEPNQFPAQPRTWGQGSGHTMEEGEKWMDSRDIQKAD